jgi:hypothetical protein
MVHSLGQQVEVEHEILVGAATRVVKLHNFVSKYCVVICTHTHTHTHTHTYRERERTTHNCRGGGM